MSEVTMDRRSATLQNERRQPSTAAAEDKPCTQLLYAAVPYREVRSSVAVEWSEMRCWLVVGSFRAQFAAAILPAQRHPPPSAPPPSLVVLLVSCRASE